MLGSWGHGAFLFYNFLFMISLFWTMHCNESLEAIQTVSSMRTEQMLENNINAVDTCVANYIIYMECAFLKKHESI